MNDWHRRLWDDETSGRGPGRALSLLLAPAEGLYRWVTLARDWAYQRGLLASTPGPIPTLAVGNLTVGGTGKTPVTAWFARALRSRGRRPAVVMRGYGGDEVEVHRRLNPAVPVLVESRRVVGVRRAHQEGADVAVLDDAFQHRALKADSYVVLMAVEEWQGSRHLLPRGPWREPLSALRRASLLVTTRKAASRDRAQAMSEELGQRFSELPRSQAHLRLAGLERYRERGPGERVALDGFRCGLAVAGVARPEAVWSQLEEAGVQVERRRAFPDHHRYSETEIAEIAREASRGAVVATLKDAVKLGAALPADSELYVPLQEVVWESGEGEVERLLGRFARMPPREPDRRT